MDFDRSKLPPNDFSSIFRQIFIVFSSIWVRFGFDFLRDLARSPEAPQDAPGRDFEAQNGCFLEVFACGNHPTRKTSDIDKTVAGAIRNALRSCRAVVENVQKSIRKRFRLRWAMRRALTGVLGVVPNAFGASPKRPEAAIERFLAALDALGVPQDRLWGGTWGFKGRPRQVWTRS